MARDWTPPEPLPGEETETDASGGLLAGLRNGAWLNEQTFPPLEYAVPGLIPEGLVFNIGAPKIGKSWFVLDCGLALATGGVALGTIAVGGARPVLYLALEDGNRRLQSRCRKLLGTATAIPAALDYLIRVEPGQVLATIGAWLDLRGDAKPLVILDTLGKVMPPALAGETTYSRDYRIGSALKGLADDHPGSTVLVNHHDRKADSADFVESVSGTNGLAGAADTIMLLIRERNQETGLLKVTGRDIPEGEYALTFTDGASWMLDGDDLSAAAVQARQRQATAGVGDRTAEVVGFVLGRPAGVRAADVAEAFKFDGDPKRDQATARTYLNRAADAGRIARLARGLFGPPVMSVMTVTSAAGQESLHDTHNAHNTSSEGGDAALFGHRRDPDLPSPVPDCGHPECVIARTGQCLSEGERATVRRINPDMFGGTAA